MTDADSLDTTHVVTVFLRHDADVLLLRRSDDVGSYSGTWGAVAGHVEGETRRTGASRRGERPGKQRDERRGDGAANGDPDAAARAEIREETGLDPDADVTHVRTVASFEVVDEDRGTRWVVHPSLFDAATRDIEPNYETVEHEWVSPTEILRRETVPDLWASYDRVRPTVETVTSDRDHGSASLSIRALELLRDEAAVAVERGGRWLTLLAVARELRGARPSMAVVVNRVNRAVAVASALDTGERDQPHVLDDASPETPAALEAAAAAEIDRALAADETAAALAAKRLPDRVATLSRSGTVLTALERADPERVVVAESRPGREGVATAERLARVTDATVTLTTDVAFAGALADESVEAVALGADAVLADGRVVNKVGSCAAATVADATGLDCVVVAASDKVRPDDAVHRAERDPGDVYDGDAPLRVANPTFEAVPPDRVDAVVTEHGALDAAAVRSVADEHRTLSEW